jgi:hypothetical protein
MVANNPPVIDSSLRKLVDTFNAELGSDEQDKRIVFGQESAGGRVWSTMKPGGVPFGLTWTYDQGYLVAASDRASAERAIATRNGGFPLVWSPEFLGQLPSSAGIHPSAFAWLNTKGALGILSALAPSPALGELVAERDPVLVVFDGTAEQIHAASRTRVSGLIMDVMLLESLSRRAGFEAVAVCETVRPVTGSGVGVPGRGSGAAERHTAYACTCPGPTRGGSHRSHANRPQPGRASSGGRQAVARRRPGALEAGRGTVPVVELENLKVRLGRREILHGISCRLGVSGTGKAVGLLGPNGAGKSTLILTLLGFLRPSAGRARILGLDCRRSMGEARSRIGYMPENDSFIGDMTAVTFLRQMAELSGLPPRRRSRRRTRSCSTWGSARRATASCGPTRSG